MKTSIGWSCVLLVLFGAAIGCNGSGGSAESNVSTPSTTENTELESAFAPSTEKAAVPEKAADGTSIIPPTPEAVLKAKEERAKSKDPESDGPAADAPKTDGSAADAPKTNSPKADESASIELKPIDIAGYEKFIKDSKGKVIAVDCWASWCHPCLEKFPKFLELAKKTQGKPIQFVSLSFDFQDEADKALAFLKEQNAVHTNFILTESQSKFEDMHQYEGIPRYLIYDQTGKMVANTDDVEEAKAKVLALLEAK